MSKHGYLMQPGPLRELRVELLRNCPLHCVHCSAFAAAGHPWLLPPTRVLHLVDELADLGGRRVSFTGGEPFMYPALEALLQRCGSRKVDVRLFSSGAISEGDRLSPVAPEILQRFAPFLTSVAYSLYSVTDAVHDMVTGVAGSLTVTIEAIQRTIGTGIVAEIHFVPTRLNYQELESVAELATTLGVQRLGILRFVPHGRGAARANDLALDRQAHLWLRDTIAELRAHHSGLTFHVGSAFNALNVVDPAPCTAAIDQMVIAADGRVAPCSAFENVRMEDAAGNILLHPLQTVWWRSVFLERVRLALRTTSTCSGCLAQKVIASDRFDASVPDPLEVLVGQSQSGQEPRRRWTDGGLHRE